MRTLPISKLVLFTITWTMFSLGLTPLKAQSRKGKRLLRQLAKDSLFQNHSFGIVIQDPSTGKKILDYQGEKYFSPASNTKLLTLYSTLRELPSDTLKILKVSFVGDTAILSGTGNPAFLHPNFSDHTDQFFATQKKSLFYKHIDSISRFGPGWAWDDYPYKLSREVSAFPVNGNQVTFIPSQDSSYTAAFQPFQVNVDSSVAKVRRKEDTNTFSVPIQIGLKTSKPFRTDAISIHQALEAKLDREVAMWENALPTDFVHLTAPVRDSLLRIMMVESDNFIAEQLILHIGMTKYDMTDREAVLDSLKHKYFSNLPSKVIWRDGSGLSRYNLTTPNNIIRLYQMMERDFGREKVQSYLATTGEGTLNGLFPDNSIQVHAKTGTLSNNFVISGYIRTKKDRTLLFCFMNSNHPHTSSTMKQGVVRILKEIYSHF